MDLSKRPLVVLHGWGHSRTLWENFRQQFPDRRVFVPDLPGFGDERLVSADWGIPEYAGWVRREIEREKLSDVVLIGHSFGGRIAAYLASENPAWLAKLVLYGAPVLYRPKFSIRVRIWVAKLLKPIVPASYKRLANSELADADQSGLGRVYRNIVGYDETELLRRITVPTLLLWGEHDTAAPVRIAREAHTLIAGSQLVIAAKLGHTVHLENPTLFYGLITRFVDAA